MGHMRFMKFAIGLYAWIQSCNFKVITDQDWDRLEGFNLNAAPHNVAKL